MMTRREFLDAPAVSAAGLAVRTAPKNDRRTLASTDRLKGTAQVSLELCFDTKDGRIQANPEATRTWGREYERGWAPHV